MNRCLSDLASIEFIYQNERGLSCAPDALIVYNSMETFSLSADLEMHFTGAATVLLLQLTALPLVVAGSTMLPQSRILNLDEKGRPIVQLTLDTEFLQ